MIVNTAVLVLVIVTVLAALVVPLATLPKAKLVGDTENEDELLVPVPDKATVLFVAPPPNATERFADFAPVEVGLKTTVAVHVPPTGS